MDDLQALARALVDHEKTHRVTFTKRDDGTASAEVFAGWIHARFEQNYAGSWDLTRATYDRRPETITGLLDSIRGA